MTENQAAEIIAVLHNLEWSLKWSSWMLSILAGLRVGDLLHIGRQWVK